MSSALKYAAVLLFIMGTASHADPTENQPETTINLTWEASDTDDCHYRVEVLCCAAPESDSAIAGRAYYTRRNSCEIGLDTTQYTVVRISAVDAYGRYSPATGELVLEPGFTAKSAAVEAAKPSTYSLAQNSPNPFNASTSISFTLPEASDVSLALYNLAGQHIETLLDSSLPPGVHTYVWNPGELSSGSYFYVLDTPAGRTVKKMMYLK